MARGPARGARKKSTVRVNFSGVETQSVIPEGEYITEVVACKIEESQSGNDYLAWEMKISGGKHNGKKLYNNTSLAEQSLWATKRFLECLGVEVPDGELDLDLEEVVGMQVGVVVEHEVYKGRTRSKVVDVFPAEDEGDEKGNSKKDDDEEASYTAEEVNAMGKKELKELAEGHDLDVDLDGSTSAVRRAVLKALEKEGLLGDGKKSAKDEDDEEDEKPARRGRKSKVEDEDDDEKPAARRGRKAKDEEDEEEEKPARRGRRAAKEEDDEDEKPARKKGKAKKYTSDAINGMSEEELTEVIETHELDVDLDEHSTMRRKRSAVIDALDGAELLDD